MVTFLKSVLSCGTLKGGVSTVLCLSVITLGAPSPVWYDNPLSHPPCESG